MLAAALGLESLVVFFAVLAASRLSSLPGMLIWVGGLGLMLAFVLAAGMVRRPGGLVVAVIAQVVLVLTAIEVPAMGLIGVVFAGITWWLYSIGRRIDSARP